MRRIPSYLPFLTILTLIYLSYELAYNARLLDVAGGLATPNEIDSIQWWGRVISGLAFALGIVGMWLMPLASKRGWSLPRQVIVFGFTACIAVWAVFHAEKSLIDGIAERSSGRARNVAANLDLITRSILKHDVKLDGIDLDKGQLSTPEGKSFAALLPLAAFSTSNLDQKVRDVTQALIRGEVEDKLGSPQYYYNDIFLPSTRKMVDAYNQYADGSNKLGQALADIPKQQHQRWSEYANRLHITRRWTPASVPRPAWGRVRQDVQRSGINVPGDWQPGDQRGFFEAIRQKTESQAWDSFNNGVEQQLGSGRRLSPGLDLNSFIAQPAVQNEWREKLDLERPTELRLRETFDDVTAQVYRPTIERLVHKQLDFYEAEDEALGKGGSQEQAGEDAMRDMLVPPMALGFSLLGALIHIAKFSDCLLRFLPGRLLIKRFLILGTLGVAVVSVFRVPNQVSTSRVFVNFRKETATSLGRPLELAMTWVIQAEPYAYPQTEAIRRSLPGQPGFGFQPQNTNSENASYNIAAGAN